MELDSGMRCAGELWDSAALVQDFYTQAGLGIALTRDETLGGNDRHHAPLRLGLENKFEDHMSGGKERDGM